MRNTYTERLKEKLKEALQAGLASNAKAIAFSLPVTATADMRLMEEEPEQV